MTITAEKQSLESGLNRWGDFKSVDPGRFELVAEQLDRHSRRVFGYAVLFGVLVQTMGLIGYMAAMPADSAALPLAIGMSALLLLVVMYCYRATAFAVIRRHPVVLIPFAIFCSLVMAADQPVVQSSFYDIAYVPFIFAAFTGWRRWTLPAAATAIVAYLGSYFFGGGNTSRPMPAGEAVLVVSDTLEFVLLAAVIAFFSGMFAKQVAGLLTDQGVSTTSRDGEEDGQKPLLKRFTSRELEVSMLVAAGLTNDEIARRMFLSSRTVESHVLSARKKAGSQSRTALAVVVALASKSVVVHPAQSHADGIRVELSDDLKDGQ